jgi:hypothetical protein
MMFGLRGLLYRAAKIRAANIKIVYEADYSGIGTRGPVRDGQWML